MLNGWLIYYNCSGSELELPDMDPVPHSSQPDPDFYCEEFYTNTILTDETCTELLQMIQKTQAISFRLDEFIEVITCSQGQLAARCTRWEFIWRHIDTFSRCVISRDTVEERQVTSQRRFSLHGSSALPRLLRTIEDTTASYSIESKWCFSRRWSYKVRAVEGIHQRAQVRHIFLLARDRRCWN